MSFNVLCDVMSRADQLGKEIVSKAVTEGLMTETEYFGRPQKVVDEAQFEQEIGELKGLLGQIGYSDVLYQTFDKARREAVAFLKTDPETQDKLTRFSELTRAERIDLASGISGIFLKSFFGEEIRYQDPVIDDDPSLKTSIHRNFTLNAEGAYPIASYVAFSKAVIESETPPVFLNLVFHEACVHAAMYQLLQGQYFRYLPEDHSLYPDAEIRRARYETSSVPQFLISSLYANWGEEALAFFQSAKFVEEMGYEDAFPEDRQIREAENPQWPYDPGT